MYASVDEFRLFGIRAADQVCHSLRGVYLVGLIWPVCLQCMQLNAVGSACNMCCRMELDGLFHVLGGGVGLPSAVSWR